MNVFMARQDSWIDLHYWSNHHKLPLAPCPGDAVQQLNIEALINHTKETQTRMRNARLVGRIGYTRACFRKVFTINAAGKCVYRAVLRSFCFIQTLPAGKDQIGAFKELFFTFLQRCGRTFERRKFIHAIVNCSECLKMLCEGEGHGRVVPEYEVSYLLFGE